MRDEIVIENALVADVIARQQFVEISIELCPHPISHRNVETFLRDTLVRFGDQVGECSSKDNFASRPVQFQIEWNVERQLNKARIEVWHSQFKPPGHTR